jgi:nucleoside phosphorylase
MSRFTDYRVTAPVYTSPSRLPAIAWDKIGAQAPQPISSSYAGANAPLPKVDVVVITWTDAEWAAMDHVFLNGAQAGSSDSSTLVHKWLLFSNDAPPASRDGGPLWGYYQLIEVGGSGASGTWVLLVKSDAHLAHPPWLSGLSDLIKVILQQAAPTLILSIGTAGGASDEQRLGDVVVTNASTIVLHDADNKAAWATFPYGSGTITGDWFPNLSMATKVQDSLFYPLNTIVTQTALSSLLAETKRGPKREDQELQPYALNDLLNGALNPENLGAPVIHNEQGVPLLTTDYYYIADGNTNYAALEMDDAVISAVVKEAGKRFLSVRNISDTLVPTTGAQGQSIVPDARDAWSSAVYDAYGLYTSFNGALAAWGVIAGL